MNYENNYDEQEIDLKELLFAVLYRWRPIILIAAILGILLGGYKLASGLLTRQNAGELAETEEAYQKDMEMYQVTLAGYERDLASLQNMLEDQQNYMNDSILMHVDPSSRPKAYAEYLVKLDESGWQQYPQTVEMDPTDGLVHSYVSNLTQWADWEKITEKTGVKEEYLKELIGTSLDYSSNTFVVEVTYLDLDTAEWILDEILSQINEGHDELADLVGSHTIRQVNKGSGYFYDSGLADRQKQNSDKITSYENSIKDKNNAMEALEEPVAPAEMSKSGVLKEAIKFGVIGVLAGGFLSVCWFCAVYILNGKVHTDEELKSRFGFRILGAFALPEKTGFCCGIDRWLERMVGKAERPSEDAVLERGAVNIVNYTEDGCRILLTGTVSKEQLQNIAAKLSDKIGSRIIQVGSNLNESTETLRQLAQCQAVVLVEQRGVSRFGAIEKEREAINGLKKPVVGCFVI